MKNKISAAIVLDMGAAISNINSDKKIFDDALSLAKEYDKMGFDNLYIFDKSTDDKSHDAAIDIIKSICTSVDMPVFAAGNIKRMEDVKKILYAGCRKALLNFSKESNIEVLDEVYGKFGKEKIGVCFKEGDMSLFADKKNEIKEKISMALYLPDDLVSDTNEETLKKVSDIQIFDKDILAVYFAGKSGSETKNSLSMANKGYGDIVINISDFEKINVADIRDELNKNGYAANLFEAKFEWKDLKKAENGLVPVVTQDYKSGEVLMVAYMNEEAFNATLKSGKMTYYSRSRKCLWEKGDTSSHFQYVKALFTDCDYDTILAKVNQVGGACHTGAYSCFFNEIAKRDYNEKNPQKVLDNVYAVIKDRKEHPKEGSYTNYLFDKGLDKILKKCGEEATEITIAAKNENPNEIIYEISDYLYHMMVLMAQKNISWEDITDELSRR